MENSTKLKEVEIINYIIDRIEDFNGVEVNELHQQLFNNDYYIIGIYQAKEFLKGIEFDVIDIITEYENSNFGEVTTKFTDVEQVVNMYTYILGENILYSLDSINDNYDNILDTEIIKSIIAELKTMLKRG